MTTSLIQKLIEFHQEDPSDPFNLYAMALEYQKSATNQAKDCYNRLLIDFPDYLPTYYHAAQFFWGLEETGIAKDIFQKGIQLALKQENEKAHRELVSSFNLFMEEQLDW